MKMNAGQKIMAANKIAVILLAPIIAFAEMDSSYLVTWKHAKVFIVYIHIKHCSHTPY